MFQAPFSFEGRIRRTEYGLSYLLTSGAGFFAGAFAEASTDMVYLLMIPLYWFMFAQGAKRCHDRGNSGWYQIIPLYGLWMLFGDSDFGPNEYGPNPKGLGNMEMEDYINEIGSEEE